MLAAVGLLSRSRVSFEAVGLRVGAGAASPFRARAREAAVGANNPLDGALGLGDVVCDGVFGREAEGVFGLEGVTEAREDGLDPVGRGGVGLTVPALFTEDIDAVDMLGWNEEGGDLAGVRVAGFVPTVLGLPSRVLEGVAGVRAVVVEGRGAAALGTGAAFFGGEEGGEGEATLSELTGETAAGSTGFSAAAGSAGG